MIKLFWKIRDIDKQSGAVLIFAVLLIGVILAIGLALSTIFINKLRTSVDAKNSIPAYYAADSGIEWTLFKRAKNPAQTKPVFGIDSEFEITEDTGDGVRSLGTFRGVSRAIEVTFGGFGSPSFTPTPTPTPIISFYKGLQWTGGWASCNVVNALNTCLHSDRCDHPTTPTCGTYANGQSTLWWRDGFSNPPITITCRVSTAPLSCP